MRKAKNKKNVRLFGETAIIFSTFIALLDGYKLKIIVQLIIIHGLQVNMEYDLYL